MYKTIEEYWQDGRGWNWRNFKNYLQSSLLLKLAGVFINLNSMENDLVGWLSPSGSGFSVRAAYELFSAGYTKGGWDGWKKVGSQWVQE